MNSSKVLRIREKRDKIVNNPDCVMGCRKLEKKDFDARIRELKLIQKVR